MKKIKFKNMENKEDINENNVLFAKFMNILVSEYETIHEKDITKSQILALKYHCSWDWLIPVVEKIENMEECLYFILESNTTKIVTWDGFEFNYRVDGVFKTKILSVYKACTEFIKWYNKK